MTYQQAVAHLYQLGHELAQTPSHKFDLRLMRVLLRALGHPEQRFRSVLIAGTNGTGSTAATLESIVRAAGYRTGLYTSPHLVRVNERIRINGVAIADDDFLAVYSRVEQVSQKLVSNGELPWRPSFFEVLTAMALVFFAEANLDLAVLEVGMGGRLDATNVVEPLVSVITDIALDHQKYLGNTIAEIAGEKAGIIHAGGVVVTLPQHPQANDVIGNAILGRGARAVSAAPYVPPVSPNAEEFDRWSAANAPAAGRDQPPAASGGPRVRYSLTVLGEEVLIESPLIGRHQLRNIALAIATAVELNSAGFSISPRAIEQGVHETQWPGRLQTLRQDGVEFLLDVAHNPAGAWALRSALSQWYEDRRLIFVFGAMRDKALGEIADILFPLSEAVVATHADTPRSATAEEIREAASRTGASIQCAATVAEAVTRAKRIAGADGVVVVTGSIYVVGEAFQALGIDNT
jgi:dihydrofolate synthase/folylpolyglutamate synthase